MSEQAQRIADYLGHILEAISRIQQYTARMRREAFSANPLVQDAVIRNLEVIGEASKNLERADPNFSTRHPGTQVTA